jgi:hypothetical protein
MSNDPRIEGALRRGRELVVAQKRTEALLEEYTNDNNEEGISEAIGQLAAIRAEGNALNQLHNEHIQRNTPQPREIESGLEWTGKPAHKMGGDDALRIVNKGKQPGDPTWLSADEYNQQLARLNRAKALGEYKT